MKRISVVIDGNEYSMPRCFQAVMLLAESGRDATYRIFEDRDGELRRQLHPYEWVFPAAGDKFACVPRAIGPGGGDDMRVRMIQAAVDTAHGDDEAWDRFEEWERSDG